MGQKINPISLRLQVNRTWESRWFANKRDYADLLHEDIRVRKFIKDKYNQAGISKIVVERPAKKPCVTIFASKPGIIIGKKGGDIETLRQKLNQITNADVVLNIVEVRKPELDAALTAESIAQQIERRVSYKKAMKKAIQNAMRMGAEGIRILCAGRLGGAEIARSEEYREGRVPLHTIRADVDYAEGSAHTTFGVCGIKVWIFKGEVLEHDPMAHEKKITQRS